MLHYPMLLSIHQTARQVLQQVYPIHAHMVDGELVPSIQQPSLHPNAPGIFYRVITRTTGASVYVNDFVAEAPREQRTLLVVLGRSRSLDPTGRGESHSTIVYPRAQRVSFDAGHCAHDEDAKAVNTVIQQFFYPTVHQSRLFWIQVKGHQPQCGAIGRSCPVEVF
jgi:hypothetical protein